MIGIRAGFVLFLLPLVLCTNTGEVVIPVSVQPPSLDPTSATGLRTILTGSNSLERVIVPLTDITVGSQQQPFIARLDLDVNNLVVNGQYDPNVASFDPSAENGATILPYFALYQFSTSWWYCSSCESVLAPVQIGSFRSYQSSVLFLFSISIE